MTCMLSRLGFVSASKCKRKRIDDTYNKELSWAFGASYILCGLLSVTYFHPISQTAWKKLTSLGAGAQVNKGMPLSGAPKALARSCSWACGDPNLSNWLPWEWISLSHNSFQFFKLSQHGFANRFLIFLAVWKLLPARSQPMEGLCLALGLNKLAAYCLKWHWNILKSKSPFGRQIHGIPFVPPKYDEISSKNTNQRRHFTQHWVE